MEFRRSQLQGVLNAKKVALDVAKEFEELTGRKYGLFEMVNGEYKLSYKPKEKLAIEEWLKTQGRFKHLFKTEGGKALIAEIQAEVDKRWKHLLFLCGEIE